mgnify:CR=1 FL=1
MPSSSSYSIGKGLEQIVFIENSANKNHTISAFLFQVKKIKTRIGFRIHFYKKSIDSFMPGEEITNQNKIYFLEKTAVPTLLSWNLPKILPFSNGIHQIVENNSIF